MLTVYGFPLSADEIIRAETRHEAIDRMAEEAKAELQVMVQTYIAPHTRWVITHDMEKRAEALVHEQLRNARLQAYAVNNYYNNYGIGIMSRALERLL